MTKYIPAMRIDTDPRREGWPCFKKMARVAAVRAVFPRKIGKKPGAALHKAPNGSYLGGTR